MVQPGTTDQLNSLIDSVVNSLTPEQALSLTTRLFSGLTIRAAQSSAASVAPTPVAVKTASDPTTPPAKTSQPLPLPVSVYPPVPQRAQNNDQTVSFAAEVAMRQRLHAGEAVPPEAKPVKLKTMAEATGVAARKDEKDAETLKQAAAKPDIAVYKPAVYSEKNPAPPQVNLKNIVATCPDALREQQPAGFAPEDALRRHINGILIQADFPNADMIRERIVYATKDAPSVDVSDARYAGFDPIFVCGRELESSASRLFIGYAQPSPATLRGALDYLTTVFGLWAQGGEFPARGAPSTARQDIAYKDGDNRSSKALENYHHHPKIYVFKPYDNPGQIAVVIA